MYAPQYAIKKAIPLTFCFAIGTQIVETLEGPVTANTGDVILTGTRNESWPIIRSKFDETYDIIDYAGLCAKKCIRVLVQRMDAPFEVTVGWLSEPLKGKAGDYHVTYGENDFGIVDFDIFNETYDIVD